MPDLIPPALWAIIGAAIMAVVGIPLGRFIGKQEGRQQAETERDLSEHQQAEKGREAAAQERERTAGFDPQHLKEAWDERTDQWRER